MISNRPRRLDPEAVMKMGDMIRKRPRYVAQFSNSNGGRARSVSTLQGRSRTTKVLSRWASQNGSLSFMLHTSRSGLAITRQAVGEMSIPFH
jgi:hypothetical protein